MKASNEMQNSILNIVKTWTDDLSMCDGRNLNGVAITLNYANEATKDAPEGYWDYCEVVIQDVRWDGTRNRNERDIYYVLHDGDINKL
ncbi:MAG: hypothetical protein IJO90_04615 [Alistipes sp.]|nr:hypothetical protein [Alistipes sp.]MBQ9962634.1 hypothetical protein [Alistipes sp.]